MEKLEQLRKYDHRSPSPLVPGVTGSSPAEIPKLPSLIHKWDTNDSIISSIVANTNQLLICGTQNGKILIFNLLNYTLISTITDDVTGSNLCLHLSESETCLFVAGSDSLIKIYDITDITMEKEPTLMKILYCSVDIGDIFALYYLESLQLLFIGTQNAAIIWFRLSLAQLKSKGRKEKKDDLPQLRYNKFFDSIGPSGPNISSMMGPKKDCKFLTDIDLCKMNLSDSLSFAHYGYVYVLKMFINEFNKLKFPTFENILISGGGDGIINLWGLVDSPENGLSGIKLHKLKSLENEESILSMDIVNTYLYAGLSNGVINVWDLLTFQLIKSYSIRNEPQINSLKVVDNLILYSAKMGFNILDTLNGQITNLNNQSSLTMHLYKKAADSTSDANELLLISAGVKNINLYKFERRPSNDMPINWNLQINNELLLKNLSKLISFKTISKCGNYIDESRNCAKFLIKLLHKFGASTTNVIPVDGGNPIIISKFENNKKQSSVKRILYYGHYDVVEAKEDCDHWSTNPFEMVSKNGYLYGRGISDNKGPTLAMIHAIGELHQAGKLDIDVTLVIEGEEENGSKQFHKKFTENRSLVGEIDWILLSNSYWLDDNRPCLNYGLRGVLNCSVTIESDKPDRHSGVDGGISKEPTMDLIQLFGSLVDGKSEGHIQIPHFYDEVKPICSKELNLIKDIVNYDEESFHLDDLLTKWTKPSLTIHKIEVSGPQTDTIIPKSAKGSLSLRIVPNQDIDSIKTNLIKHLSDTFTQLHSDNHLKLDIFHEVEPWLGDYDNSIYKVLYSNLKKNWQQDPLLIREGGSIPTIRFLEKTLKAPACQIPCGQASDNAHLKDEKLRILNLFKLKDILIDTFTELGNL